MRRNWTETTLGEAVKVQKGKKPPALVAFGDFSSPYLTADVLRGAPCEQFVPDEHLGRCIQLNGRETVLLWDGAAGDVFKSQPGVLASTMAKLEARDRHSIDDGYLYLFVLSMEAAIKSSCRGTTVPHVSPEALKSLKFPIPPLSEQRRIVDLVSSVDSYIAALQQQADAARAARSAVLSELLSAGGDDWIETTLGDVTELNPEATKNFPADQVIRYIDLASVSHEGGISPNLTEVRYGDAPGRARRVVRAADVLVSTVRPYLRGFAQVPKHLDGEVASTGFAVIRAKLDKTLTGFIWAVVGTEPFVLHLMDRATGSNYPAVRPEDLASFKLMLPPIAEQRRIVDLVSSMDDMIKTTQQAMINAARSRSGLLSDLLSGDHEIPESYDRLFGAV